MTMIQGATSATAATTAASGSASTVKVWDPLVRIFHWSLALAFATAFIVEDDLLAVHVWAGYLALALIGIRLIWGLIGPRHARFSDFVRGPSRVVGYLRDAMQFRAKRYLGHNPAAGAMVVTLLFMVSATGISGMALYGAEELSGPLAPLLSGLGPAWGQGLEEVHEVFANLTLALIGVHVLGVLFSSLSHQENLVRAMFDGRKRVD